MNRLMLAMVIILLSFFGAEQSIAQVKKTTNPIVGEWKFLSEYEKSEDAAVITENLLSYSFLSKQYEFSANGKGYLLTRVDPEDEEEVMSADDITWKVNGNKISIYYNSPEYKEAIYESYTYTIEGDKLTISSTRKMDDATITEKYSFKKI
ncbi:lipocalin-like domain-containing protein [Sphingobacterium yanglingense]|uniref:Lipocalin-like protein n=1 Tax=Sphingobacterium yanglingense TaxID=1437280 RepID=A0A4R6W587_9SPHI|nr:lipocalin family protein [Sphingobacterium yanglingense]TDQ73918.1 lipocalin-like protein [Sphingobacterium yanglingense]